MKAVSMTTEDIPTTSPYHTLGTGAVTTRKQENPPPCKEPSPEDIEAWRKAGGRYCAARQWVYNSSELWEQEFGEWVCVAMEPWSDDGGETPGFSISRLVGNHQLPDPQVPFGLEIYEV